MKEGKVLCLFSVKGGVGKTTFATALAGVASNLQIKTLIIDMDIYSGGIALALNKKVNKTIYNFVDDYNNHIYKDIKDYIVNYNEFIDYISCPKDPRKSSRINSTYLDILIDKVKYNYDLIILDTNHILNEINLNLLDKSDNILFMLNNDTYNIKNMRNLINIFKDLEKDNYKVLLNNGIYENRNYYNLGDIKEVIGCNIDYTLSNKFYINNIDGYLYDGKIITLEKNVVDKKDYRVMNLILEDLFNKVGDKYE